MVNENLHDLAVNIGGSTKDVHSFGEPYSIIPLSIRKNLTITPIDITLPDFQKKMDQNKKSIEHVLCESKKPVALSNLKNLKEANLSSTKNKEDILSMLNKLPDITFKYVKSDPIFKIPEIPTPIPKYIKNNYKKITKSEVIFKKKNIYNTKKSLIIKQKLMNNYNPFITTDVSNAIIKKSDEKEYRNFKKALEKKNMQKSSSPDIFKKENAYSLSNDCNISHEIKVIPKNESIINNMVLEKNYLVNEECTLMDSKKVIDDHDSVNEECTLMDSKKVIEDQITIADHTLPLDLININDSEYNN